MNHQGFSSKNGLTMLQGKVNDAADFIDIDRLISMLARQAWIIAIGAVVGLVLGVAYLATTPKKYFAVANVLMDERLSKLVEDVSPAPAIMQNDALILSQIEILKSSRLAKSVVQKINLDKNETFLNPPRSALATGIGTVKGMIMSFIPSGTSPPVRSTKQIDPKEREKLIAQARVNYAALVLQAGVMARRVGRSYVISIGFQSHDPQLAALITNAYASAYLDDQLNANFEATEKASTWLQGRLDELQRSSQAAALEAEAYRSEHGLTVARGELIAEQQLSDLNAQLALATADTARASARYEQSKALIKSGPEEAVRYISTLSNENSNAGIEELKSSYSTVGKREQEISLKFGPNHPQAVALRVELAELSKQLFAKLESISANLRNEFEVAQSRELALRESVEGVLGQNTQDNQSLVRLRELEQRATALSALYQSFLAQYEQVSQQRSFPVAKVRVISQATIPTGASSPRGSMVLAFALVLGTMFGGGIGAFNEFRERFFRTAVDVQEKAGLNFLGYLPAIGASKTAPRGAFKIPGLPARETPLDERQMKYLNSDRMAVAVDYPTSMFAETLRNTKFACDLVMQGGECKVIGILSILPSEGKSTVASNFARLLSVNGSRTLLIDADLRNPSLTQRLEIEATTGLVEAVVNGWSWRSVAKRDTRTDLAVIPCVAREHLAHTSELMSSQNMRHFMTEASESFDFIIVDLPPLGAVIDSKALAPLIDSILMVAEWGRTPRALVTSQLAAEPIIESKILGMVLNKVNMKRLSKYSAFGSRERFLKEYSTYYGANSEINPRDNI